MVGAHFTQNAHFTLFHNYQLLRHCLHNFHD